MHQYGKLYAVLALVKKDRACCSRSSLHTSSDYNKAQSFVHGVITEYSVYITTLALLFA
jgi:hypothetical protein